MPEDGSSRHWKAKKVSSSMPTQNCGAARVISVKVVPTRSIRLPRRAAIAIPPSTPTL